MSEVFAMASAQNWRGRRLRCEFTGIGIPLNSIEKYSNILFILSCVSWAQEQKPSILEQQNQRVLYSQRAQGCVKTYLDLVDVVREGKWRVFSIFMAVSGSVFSE